MAATLNVLVLESDRGAAYRACEELEAAGHTVLRCHEPRARAFPCNAIADGHECPLDATDVDVALVVRPRPRPQPAPLEDGAACAIRRHVRLVVGGSRALDPYDEYAVEVLDRGFDVVAACERAAAAPLRTHTAAAAAALSETLEHHGVSASPEVTVRRQHGALVIHVAGAGGLDERTKSMAAIRMMAAVRAFDHDSKGIDVAFDSAVVDHSSSRTREVSRRTRWLR
jgi:hypothetical protein